MYALLGSWHWAAVQLKPLMVSWKELEGSAKPLAISVFDIVTDIYESLKAAADSPLTYSVRPAFAAGAKKLMETCSAASYPNWPFFERIRAFNPAQLHTVRLDLKWVAEGIPLIAAHSESLIEDWARYQQLARQFVSTLNGSDVHTLRCSG